MSNADTWMPLYIGDYLRDTGHLTTGEHGGYLLLLMQAWTRGGVLPADDMRLRTIAKMDQREWRRSGPTLMEFFRRDGDVLRHKRLDRELANATALTEQRRAAGKASAEARARKQSSNETPNEISTSVGTSVDDTVETEVLTKAKQTGRPSPSPSQKEDTSSLRSDGGKPPRAGPEVDPDDPKTALWREGLAILRRLTKVADGPARKLLGKMVDAAGADHVALLAVIRQAESHQPDDPVAWIKAAIVQRSGAPLLAVGGGAPDPWGVHAWVARQPDIKPGTDPDTGTQRPAINGYFPAVWAEMIATAASLPETWRGNWDAMADWMKADIGLSPTVLSAISDQAHRMRAQGQTVGAVKVFDNAVRGAAGRAAA